MPIRPLNLLTLSDWNALVSLSWDERDNKAHRDAEYSATDPLTRVVSLESIVCSQVPVASLRWRLFSNRSSWAFWSETARSRCKAWRHFDLRSVTSVDFSQVVRLLGIKCPIKWLGRHSVASSGWPSPSSLETSPAPIDVTSTSRKNEVSKRWRIIRALNALRELNESKACFAVGLVPLALISSFNRSLRPT